jgi:peptidyl-prolyl cis-trans isomerase D
VKQGADVLSRLQKGEKADVVWQPATSVTRPQHPGVDVELAKLIFRAGTAKLPAYVGVQTAQNGYTLARIEAVKEIDGIDEGKRNRYMQQISQITGEELLSAYLQDAKKAASISIKTFAEEDKK